MEQFRMVKGTVEQLEAMLNQAHADGFTSLFREFHAVGSMVMPMPGEPLPEPTYYFLMQRPASMIPDADGFIKTFRDVAVGLGFGDRLPPEPKGAKITPLKQVPPEPEAPHE